MSFRTTRVISLAVLLVTGLFSQGCEQNAGMSPEELQACKQFISDIQHSSSALDEPAIWSVPDVSPEIAILITAPYGPTDQWLELNTTLSEASRGRVMDTTNAIENAHAFVLNSSGIAFHEVLDQRFDIEPRQFLLHTGDQLKAVMIERTWRPIVLQRLESTGIE